MKPENVNPKNFKVEHILFDNSHFSIAYGTWEDGKKYLAMRWNGDISTPGYPKVFGYPMWFVIDQELHLPFIKSLVGLSHTRKNETIMVLTELI